MSQLSFVKRKIPLSDNLSSERINICIALFMEHEAIQNTKFDSSRNSLLIEYNQILISYSSLLAILYEQHISYKKSFGFNIRKTWYDYLDENTRENALAPSPACCNKPPKR
jgi:hypothetical protein